MPTSSRPFSAITSALLVGVAAFACGPSSTNTRIGGGTVQSSAEESSGTATTTDATQDPTRYAIRPQSFPKLCLDVIDDKQTVGAGFQVWTCHYLDNQTFTWDSQGLIHVYTDRCLAVSSTGKVSLAACASDNVAQQWTVDGNAVVSAQSQACLSLSTVAAKNGTTVTTQTCTGNKSTQTWLVGSRVKADSATDTSGSTSTSGGSVTLNAHAATTLTTQAAASMDSLAAQSPTRLKAQISNIETAAAQYNIQPQLLVAIAMEESTGGSDSAAYSNGGGMFQFTDTQTWAQYGTSDPDDRQNDALSVVAAAYYMASLLNENSGSLSLALREYNGPVSAGGNPNYITDIYSKMEGNF